MHAWNFSRLTNATALKTIALDVRQFIYSLTVGFKFSVHIVS